MGNTAMIWDMEMRHACMYFDDWMDIMIGHVNVLFLHDRYLLDPRNVCDQFLKALTARPFEREQPLRSIQRQPMFLHL